MSTRPAKAVLSALARAKTLVASALSFGSVRWRLMAVLAAVSLVAYGFLLYGQYRDQYDKILSFAQSSNRLLTEVMARRIEGAVRNVKTNRTLTCEKLPTVLRDMIEMGGEKPYLKARIAASTR